VSKIKLPKPQAFQRPDGLETDAPALALERWAGSPMASEADNPNTISIYEVIGEDWWTGGGVTAKRVAAALRSIGQNDVTVNINSPGGDMFEGLAIYNLLAEHPAAVRVRVMGWAASAASIIAMAGDTIEMGVGSFMMIHNCWGMVVGNQSDMRDAAETFAQFDAGLTDVYEARTGVDRDEIAALMQAETFMSANDAVERGFATGTFERSDDDQTETQARAEVTARRRVDALLAKSGLPRSERRKLLREMAGTPAAAGTDTPRAVFDDALVAATLETLRS
jgi:ATP-dependent Clp protease, protease subunit